MPAAGTPTAAAVVQAVARFYGISVEKLRSPSRASEVRRPRQVACYLASTLTAASAKEIGRAVNRDHPSVRNAINSIEFRISERGRLADEVEKLTQLLQGEPMPDAIPRRERLARAKVEIRDAEPLELGACEYWIDMTPLVFNGQLVGTLVNYLFQVVDGPRHLIPREVVVHIELDPSKVEH